MDWIDELFKEDRELIDYSWSMSLQHIVENCGLTEIEKANLLSEIEAGIDRDRAHTIKAWCEHNTPCPIDSGRNYSQTDILTKLNKIK